MTFNANGIRAAHRKHFFAWMLKQNIDVVCVQETKAQVHQLSEEILSPTGYVSFFSDAEKKGYSGVAIYTKQKPNHVQQQLGWQHADAEGRYIRVDFDDLSIISVYLPSGSSGDARQVIKYDFMEKFMPILQKYSKQRRNYIICGDWNIAHKKIDLKNWRGNMKNSGFLPEERQWMDQLFNSVGMIDAFREVNQEAEQYTWWSNRGQARKNNVGWRLDYQIVSAELSKHIISAEIYTKERFSDHAPLIMEYAINL